MNLASPRLAFLALGLALPTLVACGDDSNVGTGGAGGDSTSTSTSTSTSPTTTTVATTADTTTQTTTVGSGGGGEGGGGAGGGGDGGGGGVPTTCDASEPLEHPTCADPCPIAVDVAIRCTDRNFAEYGVSIAPTADLVAVGVASPDEPRVVTLQGDAIDWDRNPFEGEPSPLFVAATRDGDIGVAADETTFGDQPNDYPGGVVLAESVDGAAFTREDVADAPDKFIPVLAFEYAPDGRPFVFYERFPGVEVAVRDEGGWTAEPVYSNELTGYNEYTVSPDGEVVAIDTVESGSGFSIRARVGDAAPVTLGSVESFGPQLFRPLPPPSADLPTDTPTLAVVAQGNDGVVLLWDAESGPSEVAIPGTESFVATCNVGFGDPQDCPTEEPCLEDGVGVVPAAWAAARTADGSVVVAYVVTQFAQTFEYEVQCGDPEGQNECYCVGNLLSDESTATLHVVRVDVGGETEEVLELPIGRFDPGEYTNGFVDMRSIDARAHGDDVAIALRVLDDVGAPSVRVLRLVPPVVR